MVLKIVLKVDISCDKCKKELLHVVCGLQGVDKVEADSEKGTLTVTGVADPYDIVLHIRKACKFVHIVSVGPPPKPEEKKEPEKKCCCPGAPCPACKPKPCLCPGTSSSGCKTCKPPPCPCPCPGSSCSGCSTCKPYPYPYLYPCPGYSCSGCGICRPVAFMKFDYQDPIPPCSIM